MRKILLPVFLAVIFCVSFSVENDTCNRRLEETIEQMTIDEKIGQMFIGGFEGTAISPKGTDLIENYKIGGFIFFAPNVESELQIRKLISDMEETNKNNKFRLFFCVDEEGGRISRLSKIYGALPSNLEIGYTGIKNLAFEKGVILGEELSEVGINVDFAPVLDIFSNPENKVIGDRAFSNEEERVSEFGTELFKGIQSKGIIAVGKHFPGHGDTKTDSHFGLPVVSKKLNELQNFEMRPFKHAVDEGIEMMMISHILFSEIDNEFPASLSQKIVTGVLREEMGFDGVIITDDMEMKAVADNYLLENSVIQAVEAGNDIILICRKPDKIILGIESLKKAVSEGKISEERINKSVYRILLLKEKYLKENITISEKIKRFNEKIKNYSIEINDK